MYFFYDMYKDFLLYRRTEEEPQLTRVMWNLTLYIFIRKYKVCYFTSFENSYPEQMNCYDQQRVTVQNKHLCSSGPCKHPNWNLISPFGSFPCIVVISLLSQATSEAFGDSGALWLVLLPRTISLGTSRWTISEQTSLGWEKSPENTGLTPKTRKCAVTSCVLDTEYSSA